jgi:hypothetical protein
VQQDGDSICCNEETLSCLQCAPTAEDVAQLEVRMPLRWRVQSQSIVIGGTAVGRLCWPPYVDLPVLTPTPRPLHADILRERPPPNSVASQHTTRPIHHHTC